MPWDDDENDDYDLDGVTNAPDRSRGVRFGEGQPINRRGRPRGSPNLATLVKRVSKQRHRVVIDGKVRTKGTVELLIFALQKKAAEGDLRAIQLQKSLLQRLSPVHEKASAVLIRGEKLNIDEWQAVYGEQYTDDDVSELFPHLADAREREKTFNKVAHRKTIDAIFERTK